MPDGSPRPLGETVPFRTVYIHALVRDANREKMSKTKGNVIDPIEIVSQYGTDAVRFTLASMASPGTDIAFNIARTEGYRAFANKIWNAARFIFMNVDKAAEAGITVDRSELGKMPSVAEGAPLEDRWIVASLALAANDANQALASYRFDEAANIIYQFFWGNFCDWYLEIVKLRLDLAESADKGIVKAALTTLITVFEAALRLLSPFMPFLTEELWHSVFKSSPPNGSVALSVYPSRTFDPDLRSLRQMQFIQDLIGVAREERKNREIPERESVPMRIVKNPAREFGVDSSQLIQANARIIQRLARISEITFCDRGKETLDELVWRSTDLAEIALVHKKPIDVPAERERLTKDIAKYDKNIASAERQLSNESFLSKAPAHIVEGLKKQLEENRLLRDKARAALDALPPENGQSPEDTKDDDPPPEGETES
jgi:valyl-tRNA synthetase